jgi:hypothetical protein
MTLIVNGSWTQLQQLPKLWYPMGSGGAWLNYLTWCSLHNQSISGDVDNFDFPVIESIVNSNSEIKYQNYFQRREHSITWHDCEIVLGSDRAWFNFFLNLQKKTGRSEDQGVRYQIAAQYAGWIRRGVQFNLEWCDIWQEPEQFLSRLKELTTLNLLFNAGAEQAFDQYRRSCVFEPESGDLDIYQRAVRELATDQETTNDNARLQRAREIVYTTWYRI